MDTETLFDFSLVKNATLCVFDPARIRIECLEGSLWITLDGDLEDVVVNFGETFSTPKHVSAVVNALSDSRVRLSIIQGKPSSFFDAFSISRKTDEVTINLTLRPLELRIL